MSYHPTLADIDPKLTKPAPYVPTLADIDPRLTKPDPSKQHGTLYNVGAGFVNPFINALNLIPEGVTAGMHMLGAKKFQDPLVPTIPNQGGLAYDIGELGGFAVPFGGALKGVEGAAALAKEAPLLGKGISALERIPGVALGERLATPAAAGAITGSATTSPTQGRGAGALGGAIGGGLGGALGEILPAIASPLMTKGKKIAAGAVRPLHRFFNESISRVHDTPGSEHLKNAYEGVKGLVDWEGLKPLAKEASKGVTLKDDLYRNDLTNIIKEAQEEAKTDPDVSTGISGKLSKLDRPVTNYEDAIKLKKNINNLANWDSSTRNTENRLARVYSGRLGNSLDKMIDENAASAPEGKQEAVNNFTQQWRNQRNIYKRLQQFYTHPSTKKFSQPLKNAFENGDYEKALKTFVPSAQEDMTKVNHLRGLLGNSENADNAILQKGLQPYLDQEGNTNSVKLGEAINKQKISPSIINLLNEPEKKSLSQIVNSQQISKELSKDPSLLKRMTRHPFFSAGVLGTIGHLSKLPLEWSAALGSTGLIAPQMISKGLTTAAERKASRLIESGEWDKLKGLGEEIKKARKRPRVLPAVTGALGKELAIGAQQ